MVAHQRKAEPRVVAIEIDLVVERDDDAPTDEKFSVRLRELEAFCRMLRREGGGNSTTVLFRRRSDNTAYYLRSLVRRRT